MSFAAYEALPFGGNPVELYLFSSEGKLHRYVHYDTDVTVDGYAWTAAKLNRTRFARGEGVSKAEITISASLDLPFLDLFASGIPDSPISLTIYRVHLSDPDLEKRLVWSGQILSRTCRDKEVFLSGSVPETELGSLGLRRRYQANCPYPLYKAGCWVNKDLYKVSTTITNISANWLTLTVPIGDGKKYSAGFLTYQSDTYLHKAHITQGGQDRLVLARPVAWVQVGRTVSIYPGCDRTMATCASRFNNLNNFGGFPGIPTNNLFSTQAF